MDEGVEVGLSLEPFIRETEVSMAYDYRKPDDGFTENDCSNLYVQVRRKF